MNARRALRDAADAVAAATGVLAARLRSMRSGLTILTYHRVLPDEIAGSFPLKSLVVTRSVFEAHARWLARNADIVTVAEALDRSPTSGERRSLVSITFDDGYSDNALVAAPILRDAGLRATFFVATGFIGTARLLWFDAAARWWCSAGPGDVVSAMSSGGAANGDPKPSLTAWMSFLKGLPPAGRSSVLRGLAGFSDQAAGDLDRMMTHDEVRALSAEGHEIASHTRSHPILTGLDGAGLDEELAGSRRDLRQIIGRDVPGLCYPNGDRDGCVVEAARRAGYAYGCTTVVGRNPPNADRFGLRRVDMIPSRVTAASGVHSDRALAAEISLLHEAFR